MPRTTPGVRTPSPRHRRAPFTRSGFTLIELLVVVSVISLLLGILLPAVGRARDAARSTQCLSNQRQIAAASHMYMNENRGHFFHHHEGWVLDDGSQVDDLPSSISAVTGGGVGSSHAEKPWSIFLYPFLETRQAGFCPSDPTPRSNTLATTLKDYHGGIEHPDEDPAPGSELALAEEKRLTITSYMLNSIYSHKSARYALEGAIRGFATLSNVKNPNTIMFSERNSEAMNAEDNDTFGSIGQDDYDAWVGESALVRWGEGNYADQGWLRNGRHNGRAAYIHHDGHADMLSWSEARADQFPDRKIRSPLADPPR